MIQYQIKFKRSSIFQLEGNCQALSASRMVDLPTPRQLASVCSGGRRSPIVSFDCSIIRIRALMTDLSSVGLLRGRSSCEAEATGEGVSASTCSLVFLLDGLLITAGLTINLGISNIRLSDNVQIAIYVHAIVSRSRTIEMDV